MSVVGAPRDAALFNVDELEPSELAVVATADAGATTRSDPVAAPVHAGR